MYKYKALTSEIIEAFYKVYNTLGYGFLEAVYEKSLYLELKNKGMNVVRQQRIEVFYENQSVGIYFADLLVDNHVVVEIKAAATLRKEHEIQLLNYLKATNIEVGLLLNFGKEPEIKRRIYSNE